MASITTSFLVEEDRTGKGRGQGKGGKGSGSRSTRGKGGKGGKGAENEKRAQAAAASAAPAPDTGAPQEVAVLPRSNNAALEESKVSHGSEAGLKNPTRVGRKKAANKKTGQAAAPKPDAKAKQPIVKAADKKIAPPPVSLQTELLQSIATFEASDASGNNMVTFDEVLARVVAAPNKVNILNQAGPLPRTVTAQAPSLLGGGKKATPFYVAVSMDAPIAVLEKLLAAGATDRWSGLPGGSALVSAATRGKAHAVALLVTSAPPFGIQQAQDSEEKSDGNPLTPSAEKELVVAAAAVLAAPSLKDELLVLDLLRLIAHALARGQRQQGQLLHSHDHQGGMGIAREPSLRRLLDRVATLMRQGIPPVHARHLDTFHAISLGHLLVLRRWPTLLFTALRPFLGTEFLCSTTATSSQGQDLAKLEDYLQPAAEAPLHARMPASALQFAEVELEHWRASVKSGLWSEASSECYETESDSDESRSSSNSDSSRSSDNSSRSREDNESCSADSSERSLPRQTTYVGLRGGGKGGRGGRGGGGGRGSGGRGGRGQGGRSNRGMPEQRPAPPKETTEAVPEKAKLLVIEGATPETATSEERAAALDALWLCALVMAEAMGLCASVDSGQALQSDRTKREVLAVFGLERVIQALAAMYPKDQDLSRASIIGDVCFMHQHAQAQRVNQLSWNNKPPSSSGLRDLACWHTLVRPLADQSSALVSPTMLAASKHSNEELEEQWSSHWKQLFAQQGSEAWGARMSHVLQGSRAPPPHIVPMHPIHAAMMKPKPTPAAAAAASTDSTNAAIASAAHDASAVVAPLKTKGATSEEIIDKMTTIVTERLMNFSDAKGKGRGKGKGSNKGKGKGGLGKGSGQGQSEEVAESSGFKPYPYKHDSTSSTPSLEAQSSSRSTNANAHFALTSGSVEFILKVLCENSATPVVLLSWVYILSELCSGYGPSLLDDASASAGTNRQRGNDHNNCGGDSTAVRALRESHFDCLSRPSVWRQIMTVTAHVGFVLLYGATGQHESDDGDVLPDREKELFDSLWELILRLLPPYATRLALNFTSENGSGGGGSNGSSAHGNRAAAAAEQAGLEDTVRELSPILHSLWIGLQHALTVVQGNVYLMPERFGSLLRAYYVWTALAARPADANTASAFAADSTATAGSATLSSTYSSSGTRSLNSKKRDGNRRSGSSSAVGAIAALLRACAQPPTLERHSAARRGRLWTLFASALRSATSGTMGVGRSGARFTGQVCRVPAGNRGGGGAKHPLQNWPGLPVSSDLLSFLADPLVKRGVNALVATECDLLRGELAFMLRIPGVIGTKHKVELIEQELTSRSTGRLLELAVNRMSVPLPGQLNATAEQLVAASPAVLSTGDLAVGFEDEEGVGAGPVREFLDVAAGLFRPLSDQDAALANQKKAEARLFEAGATLVGAFVRAPGDSSGLAVVPRPPTARPTLPPGVELLAAQLEKEVNLVMRPKAAALAPPGGGAASLSGAGGGGWRRGPRGGNARQRPDLGVAEGLQFGMLRLHAMAEACRASMLKTERSAGAAAEPSGSTAPISEPSGSSAPISEPSGSNGAPAGESTSTPPLPAGTAATPEGAAGASGNGKGKGRQQRRGGKGGGKGDGGGAARPLDAANAMQADGKLDKESLESLRNSLSDTELGMVLEFAKGLGNWSISETLASRDALACGRLLGLSLKAATPIGVLLPLALWHELLAKDAGPFDGQSSGGGAANINSTMPEVPPEVDWRAYCLDDEAFERGLSQLLEMPPDQVEAMNLTFAVTEVVSSSEEVPGDSTPLATSKEVELLPGGSTISVTSSNAPTYVYLAARRKLFRGADCRIRLLKQGLRDVIPANLLAVFTPQEVQSIVSGPLTIDVGAWRKATVHQRGLTPNHPVAQWFWEVVQSMSEPARRKLLLFWSASSTAPLFGFGGMAPGDGGVADDEESWKVEKMSRHDVAHGASLDHWFPEASTCDRTLRLPAYSNKAALARNLALALDLGGVGYDRA